MSYLYKNEFEDIYQGDVGNIAKVIDPDSIFDTKLMYVAGGTFNGYCYKDYNNFKNNPDEVCYIAECCFDTDTLFVDYVNENKEKLIEEGGLATANSIKEEVKNCLIHDEYYYEYQENDVVHTIEAKKFDEKLIDKIANIVFDVVDWQTTQGYIYEADWCEVIEDFYEEKLKDKGMQI